MGSEMCIRDSSTFASPALRIDKADTHFLLSKEYLQHYLKSHMDSLPETAELTATATLSQAVSPSRLDRSASPGAFHGNCLAEIFLCRSIPQMVAAGESNLS